MNPTDTVISLSDLPEKNHTLNFSKKPCPFCGEKDKLETIFAFTNSDLKYLYYQEKGYIPDENSRVNPNIKMITIIECETCSQYHSENIDANYLWYSDIMDPQELDNFKDDLFLNCTSESIKNLYFNPDINKIKSSLSLDNETINLIKEADIAFNLNLKTAAAACYRRSLEFIINRILEKNNIPAPQDLSKKIKTLYDEKIIGTLTKDKMKAITFLGNDAIHTSKKHASFDVKDMKKLFHSLLNDYIEGEIISFIVDK